MFLILALAVLPSIALMVYTYRLDRVESEPLDLVRRIFFSGALSTVFAMALESVGAYLLSRADLSEGGILYNFLFFFVVVAVSEELVKYIPTRRNAWYHPAFDCAFDAVVYAVAAALGFAAAENIMYVVGYGITVAPTRAIFAVPMHGICGVFMGHHMGMAKYAESEFRWGAMHMHNILSLAIPIILHGYYDFCLSVDNEILSGSFIFFVIILDIIAFRSLKKYAREDVFFGS